LKILRITTISCLFCLLFAGITYAETDMQKGIRLAQMYDRMPTFGRVKAYITLRIFDGSGNIRFSKKMRMASYTENLGASNEVEKFIAYFTEPADDLGNSMLFYNYADKADEKFMYLKSIRKTKKVAGADKKLSFFGSDFSNAEVSMPEFQDYTYRFLRDDKMTFKGKELDCYVIEALPKTPIVASDMGYGKKTMFLEKSTLIMMKTEYYNERMEKFKEMRLVSFITKNNVQGKKVYYNTGIEMKNVKKGTKSVLVFSDYLFEEDSGISDRIFNIDYLTRKWW
jgi:hypothetical protein